MHEGCSTRDMTAQGGRTASQELRPCAFHCRLAIAGGYRGRAPLRTPSDGVVATDGHKIVGVMGAVNAKCSEIW